MRVDALNAFDATEIAKRWCVAFDKPIGDHPAIAVEISTACRGFPTRTVVAAFEALQHEHVGARAPRFSALRAKCQQLEKQGLDRQHGAGLKDRYLKWLGQPDSGCPVCDHWIVLTPRTDYKCDVIVHDSKGMPTVGVAQCEAQRIRAAWKARPRQDPVSPVVREMFAGAPVEQGDAFEEAPA